MTVLPRFGKFHVKLSEPSFDDWRPRYNHERPHEALGMATPAQRHQPSSRPFPEVPPPVEYAPRR